MTPHSLRRYQSNSDSRGKISSDFRIGLLTPNLALQLFNSKSLLSSSSIKA